MYQGHADVRFVMTWTSPAHTKIVQRGLQYIRVLGSLGLKLMQRVSLHPRADTTRNIETFQATCRY